MLKRPLRAALALLVLSSFTLRAAEPLATPEVRPDELKAALKKLTDLANYSWEAHTTDGDNAQGAIDGKTTKDGTTFTLVQFQATSPAVYQGGKVVVLMDDGKWLGIDEIARAASEARIAQNLARAAAGGAFEISTPSPLAIYNSLQYACLPTEDIKAVFATLTTVQKNGNEFTAQLTPEVTADLLMNRRPGSDTATLGGRVRRGDAAGTLKVTVQDGLLVKYQVSMFNSDGSGRTNSFVFKDIGATKLTIPADAQAKLTALLTPAKPPTATAPATASRPATLR